jgi:general stress protein YciG
MTVRDAGRKGGRATKARHGPEFYETIGRKGGETTKKRHGPKFYERIGRKGGQRVRHLVEQGKRVQPR